MGTMNIKYHYNSKYPLPDNLEKIRAMMMNQYRKTAENPEGLTLKDLGRMFGLSRERVRQILEKYNQHEIIN